MNIFFIDNCPAQAAKWLVDKHMKMLLESCQMLCTNYRLQGIEAPYRASHANHPSTKWARESYDNCQWLIEHAYGIAKEYTERYKKRHKSEDVLDWARQNFNKLSFNTKDLTPFAIAISDNSICRTIPEFNNVDTVAKYRLYYQHDKKPIHEWKQNKPDWIV